MKPFQNIKSLDPETQASIRLGREKHEALLFKLGQQHLDLSKGYFGPESMTWKLYREPSIMLGSMRALLLQIAHPAVAIGVSMYSNYTKDFVGRAHRTILSMVRLWYGDIPTANNSARRLHHIHSMIRGQMVWETEDETIVNPFCAADPDLLYWVLATIVDTTITLYEKTVRPLSKEEKEQFYEESKITAQLMGITLDEYPETLEAFNLRFNQVVTEGTLRLQKEGKSVTEALFKTPYPVRRFTEILADHFLPENGKKIFGFKSNKRFAKIVLRLARLINRLIPNDLRYAPHYHQANFRIALSERKTPKIIERLHYWMGAHINWYFISNRLTIKRT